MAAVNWNQPSAGVVTDPLPSLMLKNAQGGALEARSNGTTVAARSQTSMAVDARTKTTLTGKFESDQFVGLLARAPRSVAVIGGNESRVPAVGGVNLPDPAIPNIISN